MTVTSTAQRRTDVVRSRAEFLKARARLGDGSVGVVLTMGALHAGHEALLDAARDTNEHVVATVFVNPAQFAVNEDLSRYPRPLDADLDVLRRHGVDLAWVPAVEDVYPHPPRVGIDPGALGRELEGASRPTHFAGMLLVVAKFLHLVRPDAAYFGEKDYQQLTLVRAMVRDLELPVDIVGVPTVREADGLARSSRNVFLDAGQRRAAAALSRALFAGQAAAGDGGAVLAAARAALNQHADAPASTNSADTPASANSADAPDPAGAPASANSADAPEAAEAPDPAGAPDPAHAAGPANAADPVSASDAPAAVDVDYLELRSPDLGPAPWHGPARLLVAARVGSTRLIDNVPVELVP